jgi:hypothetical protein
LEARQTRELTSRKEREIDRATRLGPSATKKCRVRMTRVGGMAFEQAAIKVEKAEEFGRLQCAIEKAFSPDNVKGFLKRLYRGKIRIRDFDAVIVCKTLEATTGRSDFSARRLYGSLSLSDQAQIREFYLSKLEEVDAPLRHKFKKLYQYY